MGIQFSNEGITDKVLELLNKTPEWAAIYAEYAEGIIKNQDDYKKARKFRVPNPLLCYSSIVKVKSKSPNKKYSLRYYGQELATIIMNSNWKCPELSLTKTQASFLNTYIEKDGLEEGKKIAWHEEIANRIRSTMKNSKEKLKTHSPEHEKESRLLYEFANGKTLSDIQPVKLGGLFFQLTTPIKASDHKIGPQISLRKNNKGKYSSASGGGIDILARVKNHFGDNNSEFRLAIIELKDETKKSEPQRVVMQQALSYATFIVKLLRSESGVKWYNIFRDQKKKQNEVPKKLKIDVITLMPKDTKGEDEIGELIPIKIGEDTLYPYTLYFDYNDKEKEFTFEGTFVNRDKDLFHNKVGL